MATISKDGIQDGLTSKAEHLTRIINALDGTTNTHIIATGSFAGSLTGSFDGTATSASMAITASYAETATSSSYAITASYAENVSPGFPFTGAAQITGSLIISGSGVNTGIDFSKAGAITVPSTTTINAQRNLTQVYTGGSHIRVDLSVAGQTHAVVLPAASNNYLGREWTFDIVGFGTNSLFQITGSENKIFGTVMSASPSVTMQTISGSGALSASSGANLFQVSSINSRLTDSYTLRSLGTLGWKLNGTCDFRTAVSSSFVAG